MNISDTKTTTNAIMTLCKNSILAILSDDTLHNHNYLVNETISISRGNQLTSYKKATYFKENNLCITNGYLYEFGTGRDISTYEWPNQALINLKNVLLRNISTEICFDLFYGIRSDNRWDNLGWLLARKPTRLHVLQSNMIDAFNNHNKNNLPIDVGIAHADPYIAIHPHLPFCLLNQGVRECRYDENSPDVILRRVVIGDSMYVISIYRI